MINSKQFKSETRKNRNDQEQHHCVDSLAAYVVGLEDCIGETCHLFLSFLEGHLIALDSEARIEETWNI